jgi:hypothetical protein
LSAGVPAVDYSDLDMGQLLASAMGAPGPEIAEVAEEMGANLVVVGHRPSGPLARWLFRSVGTYLVKHLRCSVLVAQTEISDDQFAKLMVTAGLV